MIIFKWMVIVASSFWLITNIEPVRLCRLLWMLYNMHEDPFSRIVLRFGFQKIELYVYYGVVIVVN